MRLLRKINFKLNGLVRLSWRQVCFVKRFSYRLTFCIKLITTFLLFFIGSVYAQNENLIVNNSAANKSATNNNEKSNDVALTSEIPGDAQRVVIAEPFINLQTGPGRGFPVFYIVEQNQSLWILKRKYNWFNVTNGSGKIGWVPLEEILKTKNPDGSDVQFTSYTERDFVKRDWEVGFRAGDFGGANVLAISGAWQFTENLATELVVGQGLGDFSEVRQTTINVTNSPFPDWQFSPYFGIGGGVVKVIPSAALVQEVDRQDEVLFATTGLKTYITDRFLFRVEYRNYVILTTQETNEDIEEWTVGFSVFF